MWYENTSKNYDQLRVKCNAPTMETVMPYLDLLPERRSRAGPPRHTIISLALYAISLTLAALACVDGILSVSSRPQAWLCVFGVVSLLCTIHAITWRLYENWKVSPDIDIVIIGIAAANIVSALIVFGECFLFSSRPVHDSVLVVPICVFSPLLLNYGLVCIHHSTSIASFFQPPTTHSDP